MSKIPVSMEAIILNGFFVLRRVPSPTVPSALTYTIVNCLNPWGLLGLFFFSLRNTFTRYDTQEVVQENHEQF